MGASLQNPGDREHLSLNGAWHVIPDPYGFGAFSPFGGDNPRGWFRNQKPRSPSDRVEYDFATSPVHEVPGDWNTQDPTLFRYEGPVWYQRDFRVDLEPGERAFLCFGGANYTARVWLDGEALGGHEGGFTPFGFEITEALRAEAPDHFVVVQVDNARRPDAVPALANDWWNYGGLTRDVRVVRVPDTFVRDWRVELAPGTRERLRGFVELDGPDAAVAAVRLRMPDAGAGVDLRLETDADGRAAFEVDVAGLGLWSPDDPRLHAVEIEGGADRVHDRIGFRTLETRGSDILLNGEPIFLRGISLHEEGPGGGRATTADDARVLLGWARELGCNFVRLAHYPHNEHTVRLADEMGLLVWAELPVYWQIDWENPATLENARQQLRELIERDANRACVALWSVGNEAPASPPRLAFMRGLAELARELDPTRLVTAALLTLPQSEKRMHVDDPLGEVVDVIGVNEYFGWYYMTAEQTREIEWTSAYDKPMILSELGAGARRGLHGAPTERWTEEFQVAVYEAQIDMMRRIPFLAGLSPWILRDFRSPNRPLPGVQDGYNRKGLISDRGDKKQAFFVLRDFYRERAGDPDTR